MCSHTWKTINDVRVCMRCGLTVRILDGAILFDRKIANINNRKGMKANEK